MWTTPLYGDNANANAVPVAPIGSVEFKGWTNAFRLANESMEVVLVPEIGRIAHLAWREQPNLLRLDESLLGQTGDIVESDDWINFGGDWIWPVAQERWHLFQEGNWPPSRLLDGRSWTGRAWRTADDTLHGLITEDFGAPLHVRVHRTVRMERERPELVIRQRMERLEESDIPVTIWQLSQLNNVDFVFVPVGPDSNFSAGLTPLLFDMPPEDRLFHCGDIVLYRAGLGGEHKIGSDSPRKWIAALIGNTLILQKSEPGEGEGVHPDGGCSVEMFSNTELGYTEIEGLSIEKHLDAGEYFDNTLRISLHRLESIPDDLCELVNTVRKIIGEPLAQPMGKAEPSEAAEADEDET